MSNFWKVLTSSIALALLGTAIVAGLSYALVLDTRQQVETLEQGQKGLCQNLLKMGAIDDELVTLANSQDVPRIEEVYDQIFASQAYCRNAVAVYADMRGSSLRISFMGYEISDGFAKMNWWEGKDPTITLLDPAGEKLVSFNPLPFLRVGDFMKIWIAAERPDFYAFYDPDTGLAVSIQHLDGAMEVAR
jgi:hypothetical protein